MLLALVTVTLASTEKPKSILKTTPPGGTPPWVVLSRTQRGRARQVEESSGGPMRQQTVGLPSDGLKRPERGVKSRGLYLSGCDRISFETEGSPGSSVSEEDLKAYIDGTHGSDWIPYFHDGVRSWRERNWKEQEREALKLREADPTSTNDDFENGFAEDEQRLIERCISRAPASWDACRVANEWRLSVLSDQARQEEAENKAWEQWATDQYASLFEEGSLVDLGDRPDEPVILGEAQRRNEYIQKALSPRSARLEGARKAEERAAAQKQTPGAAGYPAQIY